MPAPPPDRIAWLDGLRGVAIAMVVLFHSYVRWPHVVPFGNAYAGKPWVAYGWLGVQLFFMISGFVIAMTLEKCRGPGDFLARRWLRLFPAMAICSLLVFATAPLLPERPQGTPVWRDLLPGLLFVDPGWIARVTGQPQGLLEGAFWSLFVEAKFYVVAAFSYFTLGRKGMLAILLAAFGASVVADAWGAACPPWLRAAVAAADARYFGWFAAGVLFHMHAQTGQRRTALAAILVGALAAATQSGHQRYPELFAMGVVVLFSAAACSPVIQRALSWRSLGWLGFISYPLYLLHENFIVAAIVKLGEWMPGTPAFLLPVLPIAAACLLAAPIASRLEPAFRRLLRAPLRARRTSIVPLSSSNGGA